MQGAQANIFDEAHDTPVKTIPISAAWANRAFDCTLHGIEKRCGGACCKSGPSGAIWPASAYGKEPNTRCGNLGHEGCRLALSDRPMSCLLFPLKMSKAGRLVLFHRATMERGICKGNHGHGPHLLDALRPGLEALFGAAEYERVSAALRAGKNAEFEASPALLAQIEREQREAALNLQPTPRSARLEP